MDDNQLQGNISGSGVWSQGLSVSDIRPVGDCLSRSFHNIATLNLDTSSMDSNLVRFRS